MSSSDAIRLAAFAPYRAAKRERCGLGAHGVNYRRSKILTWVETRASRHSVAAHGQVRLERRYRRHKKIRERTWRFAPSLFITANPVKDVRKGC